MRVVQFYVANVSHRNGVNIRARCGCEKGFRFLKFVSQ